MRKFRLLRALLALAAAAALAGALLRNAHAEVKKFIQLCGGQQLCPYFQLVLTPPDGWVIDQAATKKNKVQMLVPKGTTFADAPTLIYVQVFYHRDKQETLDDFAKLSNDRWLADVPNAKITPLAAVVRTNGKADFLRFAFENPSKTQQAYEVGAFGIDGDTDGNEFVLDVVMSGATKAALDKADKDYIAFLKAH
jgi:hypothetical protein